VGLLQGWIGPEDILLIVHPWKVVYHSARLPRRDDGIRVLESWNTAVQSDLSESRALDAVWRVSKLPQLDCVGELEHLEGDGGFGGARALLVRI